MFPFFHRLLRHFVTPLGIVSLGISGNDDCRVCFFSGLPPPSFEYLFLPYIIVHFLNFVLPYLRFTCICASHITSLTSRCIAYERNGHMNRKQGFTLAELLIVVAIIGVLVAVSVPIFTAQRRKAVDAVNKANIAPQRPWHWLHFMMTKLYMSQVVTAPKWLTSNIQTAVWYGLLPT